MALKIFATICLIIVSFIAWSHEQIDTNFQAPFWQKIIFFWIPNVVVLIAIWK